MGKNMAVRRLDLGYFVRPASETGGPQPRVEPVLAYLVQHDTGLILFDTGIGDADPETEAHYRPRRRGLRDALAASGVAVDDISMVVNCHLHFDHIGGNPLLGGKPILVQDVELATARRGNYTFDELIDFPGATYEEVAGETEVRPGVPRRTTSLPTSPPSNWPATRRFTAWSSRFLLISTGWIDSPISTRGACSSPTTALSGNHRRPRAAETLLPGTCHTWSCHA